MHLTRKEQFFEESLNQWSLLRGLAFAERDWAISAIIIFSVNHTFVFLTFPGIVSFVAGLLFIAPFLGFCLHLTQVALYRRLKAQKPGGLTMGDFKKLAWRANLIWFPIVFGTCFLTVDLFYDMRAEFLSAVGVKP